MSTDRVLLIDVGGVIFKTAWEMLPGYERWSGLAPGTLRWRGKFDPERDELWRSYTAGEMPERIYWQQFSEHCTAAGGRLDGFATTMIAIHKGGFDEIVRPEVRSLVRDVRQAGCRYGIFTNDLIHHFGHEWSMAFPEIGSADWFIDADAIGALKPAREAFEAALRVVGCDATDVVFLDDDDRNIVAATELGIHAVPFDVTDPASSVDHCRAALGITL